MRMFAGCIGDHIQVTELGIRDMIDRGQDNSPGHGLYRQSSLDGGRGAQ